MKPELRHFSVLSLLCLSVTAHAFPICVKSDGDFPYWVYDNASKRYLGVSGYSSEELCQKAIATRDLRIACAPAAVPQGFGSVIVGTATGTVIGFDSSYFTSVEHCSAAISSTRSGMVCIPGPREGVVSLFDFENQRLLGEGYTSVDFCQYASLSASFTRQDPYVCAMNPKGSTEVIHRETGEWMGIPFSRAQDCYEYLSQYRK